MKTILFSLACAAVLLVPGVWRWPATDGGRLHGLRARALDEVRSAVRLRPDHAPSRRLLRYLEQAAQKPAAEPAAAPGREADAGPVPEIDLTSDCLSLFTTRVQPILMNA